MRAGSDTTVGKAEGSRGMLTAIHILATSMRTELMEKALIDGPMERCTREDGKKD